MDLRISGKVYMRVGAGAPVDGVAGTGVSRGMGKGSVFLDKTNGNEYLQTGTASSPVWKLVTRAA
jgi:hypothetical protein